MLDPDTNKTACDKAITPGGSFRIRSRIIGWRESKLGLLYNPLYFNGASPSTVRRACPEARRRTAACESR